MTTPKVIPSRPLDDTTASMSIHGKVSFVVDDTDSSINSSTISAQGYYSSEKLSTYDFSNKVIGNFRDTGANPTKQSSVDVIQLSNTNIEMTVTSADGDFNSSLYFPVKNYSTDGVGFSVKTQVPVSSVVGSNTARPYYTNTNFSGISIGLFDFKTGNGLIIFFNDNQNIVIAGPASDGAGTRATNNAPITYQWDDLTTFNVLFDYVMGKALVTAVKAEEDDDVVLWEGNLSYLGTSLNSLSMANRNIQSSSDVVAFVSQDGRQVGDTIAIHDFAVYPYSYRYITNGSFTKYAVGSYRTRSGILGDDKEKHNFTHLNTSNATLYKSGKFDAIEFTSAAGYVKEAYQDLDNNQFFLFANMHTTENTFSGVNSGIGIDIFGAKKFSIRFLEEHIALRVSENLSDIRTLSGYEYYPIDIRSATDLLIYSDGTTVRVYTKANIAVPEYLLRIQVAVADLPNNTGDTCVQMVSEQGTKGVLFIKDFIFSGTTRNAITTNFNSTVSIPQGSLTYTVVTPTQLLTKTRYLPAPNTISISGSYISIPKYLPDYSGLTCVFKVRLKNTIAILPETNYGPFVILNTDSPNGNTVTHGLQLFICKAYDGNNYLYFPGDTQDVREVAYQTNKGKSISAKIPVNGQLNLCIQYDPYIGLHVYDLNDEFALILHIPIGIIDGSHKLLPNVNNEGVVLPTDIANNNYFTAAVGVLDQSPNVYIEVEQFFVGTGRGLLTEFFKQTDKIPADVLYGEQSRLIIKAGDND